MNNHLTAPSLSIRQKTKIFFPNLNGVRAFAALLVIVSHIERHKFDLHMGHVVFHMFGFGFVGVSIFFSLSGFLITYLLLEEKKNFSKVDFGDFYARRVLRIWPLYYLLIIIGFFIWPGVTSSTPVWLSFLFLPNIAFNLSMIPDIIDPIWSIGIEEQFYIFYPHFFRIRNNKYILYTQIAFIGLFFVAVAITKHICFSHPEYVIGNNLFYFARYDNMMIGGIIAVIYFNTKNKTFDFKFQKAFDLLFNKRVQVVLFALFALSIYGCGSYQIIQGDMIVSILSSLVIVNLCETATSLISLDNKVLQFTGRISYGLYLLHKIPMYGTFYLVTTYMRNTSPIFQNLALYSGTFAGTAALASLSYYGYERYFLKLKKRFQKVPNNVV